jgi:gas vesicle protein
MWLNIYYRMGDKKDNKKNKSKIRDQILELCKLAQGNITTIVWCKSQITRRLKVLDRLVERLSTISSETRENVDGSKKRIEVLIKKQTDACKELGEKIKIEIESLDAIRVASKAYGIDIKTRLLELDNKLESSDFDEFFDSDEE